MESFVGAQTVADEQYESFGWCLVGVWHGMRSHARDDWADEINIKNGINVDHVENNGDGKEAEATETCHDCETAVRTDGVERKVVTIVPNTSPNVGFTPRISIDDPDVRAAARGSGEDA